MGSVGLFQGARRVNTVLEVLSVVRELTRIHPCGCLEKGDLFFADSCDPNVLGCPGNGGNVLISDFAPCKGKLRLGELFELPGYADPLGRRAGRQPAPVPKPRDEGYGTVGLVLPGLVVPPQAIRKNRLAPVESPAQADECLAERRIVKPCQPTGELRERIEKPAKRGPRLAA
jgi:hypothetical protein